MPIPAFSFATATEIRFGRGEARRAVADIAALGTRVLLVTGGTPARAGWLIDDLRAAGCACEVHAVPGEPDCAMIEAGIATGRDAAVAAIVAIGGGAAIDAGKAIAALIPARRPMMDHLEVVGRGLPLDRAPLPFIALPTTAGTGAEVTRNAVISVPEHRRKVSLRDKAMLPRLAVIDPALTDGCPRPVTLASGLDAVTQVIEPYLCTRATPLTDALCRDAIPRGLAALRTVMVAEDPEARDTLAWVSLCGGLALANAGLGVVHGLAGPLGGLSGAAHGAICGALLPHGLATNARHCKDPVVLGRIAEIRGWIAAALGGPEVAAFDTLDRWSREMGLPGLDAQGVTAGDRSAAAEAAATSSSMKANPVPLPVAALEEMMQAAR